MTDKEPDDEDERDDDKGDQGRLDPRVLFAALLARIRDARHSSEDRL